MSEVTKKGQVHTQMVELDIEDEEGDQLGYNYHQNLLGMNWNTCLLIDSKSSIDIFNNSELLTNIHHAKKNLNCNAIPVVLI